MKYYDDIVPNVLFLQYSMIFYKNKKILVINIPPRFRNSINSILSWDEKAINLFNSQQRILLTFKT